MEIKIYKQYDNPERARRIWREYEQDFSSLDALNEANLIISGCKKADELDVLLDMLMTEIKSRRKMPVKSIPTDADADGSWGNAVSAYEGD